MQTATMGQLKRVSVTMQVEIQEALQSYAAKQSRTLSAQIEQILGTYLLGIGELPAMPTREENRGGDRKSKKKIDARKSRKSADDAPTDKSIGEGIGDE